MNRGSRLIRTCLRQQQLVPVRHYRITARVNERVVVGIPDLSANGYSIADWVRSVGDRIEAGDVIARIEANGALKEIKAMTAGILVKKMGMVNEKVIAGQPLFEIEDMTIAPDLEVESPKKFFDKGWTPESLAIMGGIVVVDFIATMAALAALGKFDGIFD